MRVGKLGLGCWMGRDGLSPRDAIQCDLCVG
jgi:hypothetical protein